METQKRTSSKNMIKLKQKQKMHSLFPEIDVKELWQRTTHGGFTTIPKTLPIIMALMDLLENGKPLSRTYLTLWCYAWDGPFVEVRNEQELALASGFSGERAVTTWRNRMRSLEEWGFIDKASGASEFAYVLILNPHIVLEKLKKDGEIKNEPLYNILIDRDIELKGKGFERQLQAKS